jgi:small subunit ribosomal protein S16
MPWLEHFMLSIRFARTGKRNMSQFKIVLQEKTAAPGGRHVEVLGSYNPHKKEAVLREDRIKYWLKQGVGVSDSPYNLFVSKGLISGKKRSVKIPKKLEQENSPETADAGKETKTEAKPEEKKPEVEAKKE